MILIGNIAPFKKNVL